MSCPTPELLEAARRVLMYLSHHRSIGLRFERSQTSIQGFLDSDWATKHSTSGYVFMYRRSAAATSLLDAPSSGHGDEPAA
eukprot:1539039-Pleurochrysis_carterae.AAC.1